MSMGYVSISLFFFFNAPAPTEIYTLSLHDALPIWTASDGGRAGNQPARKRGFPWSCAAARAGNPDRKSTRLNSSHLGISYAVFCLKKKKKKNKISTSIT